MSLTVEHGERGAIAAADPLLKIWRSYGSCATSPGNGRRMGIGGCGRYCVGSAANAASHQ